MSSAVVWLVTPILDACSIETMLAIFSSLQLCSHTGSVKLQIQNDKLFVIKFLDNSPCHICIWLSKICSPLLKKSGTRWFQWRLFHFFGTMALNYEIIFKCCRVLTDSKSLFLQELEGHIQTTCCSTSVWDIYYPVS